jgi:hypothetical protein
MLCVDNTTGETFSTFSTSLLAARVIAGQSCLGHDASVSYRRSIYGNIDMRVS